VESQRTSEYANSDSCPTLSSEATETKKLSPGWRPISCGVITLGVVCNGDSAAIEVLVYGPCVRDEVVDISSRRIIELDLYTLHRITLGIKVQRRSGRAPGWRQPPHSIADDGANFRDLSLYRGSVTDSMVHGR
jgi:hypothetical protein